MAKYCLFLILSFTLIGCVHNDTWEEGNQKIDEASNKHFRPRVDGKKKEREWYEYSSTDACSPLVNGIILGKCTHKYSFEIQVLCEIEVAGKNVPIAAKNKKIWWSLVNNAEKLDSGKLMIGGKGLFKIFIQSREHISLKDMILTVSANENTLKQDMSYFVKTRGKLVLHNNMCK